MLRRGIALWDVLASCVIRGADDASIREPQPNDIGALLPLSLIHILIVRWFQYGVFCPVFRLHGSRNGHDRTRDIIEPSGGDNELWSFGDRDYEILRDLVFLRERLRPYKMCIRDRFFTFSKKGSSTAMGRLSS